MTDELRDVLTRMRDAIKHRLQDYELGTLHDDIDRLLAADEEGKYRDEAMQLWKIIVDADWSTHAAATAVAVWLKARDARRKETDK